MSFCRIEMFDGLRLLHDGGLKTRFQTQKTASLLAFLAYHPRRAHSREDLTELLWGEVTEAAKHRLRMALSALRRDLNPAETILADRLFVRIDPESITTDVADFKAALASASTLDSEQEQTRLLVSAVDIYRGALLPGFYEDWVPAARRELEEALLGALRRLIRAFAAARDLERASIYARRAVSIDPLREEAHRDLMRLLAATGQPSAALRQFRELEELLRDELDAQPSHATTSLAEELISLGAKGTRLSHDRSNIRRQPRDSASQTPPSPGMPWFPTRFFGRDDEISDVCRLLDTNGCSDKTVRLVTLTGPGGSGKTRLAIETARRLAKRFESRMWFVPLSDTPDHRSIPQAIARAIDQPLEAEIEPLEAVMKALSHQESFLVLDNFEHLQPQGVRTVSELLFRLEGLRVLITSRCKLNLPAERDVPIGPLPCPDPAASVEELGANASVGLFVDRLQRVWPKFTLTRQNGKLIADICRRLEGMPLALELAATRARVMSLEEINENLSHRLDVLSADRSDVPERHRSLRAAIRWSYELLPADTRKLFSLLSVFRGGFAAASVPAVCLDNHAVEAAADRQIGSLPIYSMIEELCDCSMLFVEKSTGEIRFRMLETIRQFAAEELSPNARARIAKQHAEFFIGQLGDAGLIDHAPIDSGAMQFMELEERDLLAALDWAMHHDINRALTLAIQLARFWWLRGDVTKGRARLAAVIQLGISAGPCAALAHALRTAGRLAVLQGDNEAALSDYENALSIYTELADRRGIASVDRAIGTVEYRCGRVESARMRFERSLAEFRRLDARDGMAAVLNDIGLICYDDGEYDRAREMFSASESLWRELGYTERATALSNLGMVARADGRYADARAHYEAHLAIRSSEGNVAAVAHGWHNLASLAYVEGNPESAIALYAKALTEFQKRGSMSFVADSLDGCAVARCALMHWSQAARLFGAADALRDKTGLVRREPEFSDYTRAKSEARETLGDAEFYQCYLSGRNRTPEEAVVEASAHSIDAD